MNQLAIRLPGSALVLRQVHDPFIRTVVDLFEELNGWPSLKLVQQALAEQHNPSDAKWLVARLPAKTGRLDPSDNRVILTFAGFFWAQPNHPTVDDFERALYIVSRRYRKSENRRIEATISAADLTAPLSLTEQRAARVMALLESEGLIECEQSSEDGFVIKPEMHHFLYIRDARHYIKTKRKRNWERCTAKKRRAVLDATIKDRKGIRKIVIGALAILLAALIVWIVSHSWPSDSSPPSQPSHVSSEGRPQARAGPAEKSAGGFTPGSRAGPRPPSLAGRR